MKRLTHERMNGIHSGYWSPEKKEALVQRLAEYEDIGLTPEQLGYLLDLYISPKQIKEAKEEIPD